MPRKHFLLAFTLIYTPYALFISAGFLVFAYMQYQYNVDLIKTNEKVQLGLVSKSLIRDLEMILPDMQVLVNERLVQQFINQPGESNRQQVEKELESFGSNKRLYRQIRLFDVSGQEVVRVDYKDARTVIVDKENLQSKKDRYYFKEAISLGRGELYMSPLDLNVDNNKVETPYRPTIRFAMPVYNNQDIIKGVLVLNYDAEYLLSHFDDMLVGSYGHIALLNSQSYYLRSHHKDREWAFMFGKEMRFQQRHSYEWNFISSNAEGQVHTDAGLFTYVSVYPLKLIGGFENKEPDYSHHDHKHGDAEAYVWKIVSDVPSRVFQKILHDYFFGMFGIVWSILMLMGVATSAYLAISYLDRRKLLKQKELHAEIYNSSTEGIIITDKHSRILEVNSAFLEICGYSHDEVLGNTPAMFSSGRHDADFYKQLWSTLHHQGYWEGEIYNRHKMGAIYAEWIRITAIKNKRGEVSNFIAMISDITQKKSDEEQLLKSAHHDPLTGAHNRLSFDERLEHDLLLAKRNHDLLGLLYLDLDKFKPINDTHGHQAGDVILQIVTERIMHNIRETDMLARIGGDEFVVVLSQVDSIAHVNEVAETLARIIHEPCLVEGKELSVGVSIGVAVYPDNGETVRGLLAYADEKMFEAKHNH